MACEGRNEKYILIIYFFRARVEHVKYSENKLFNSKLFSILQLGRYSKCEYKQKKKLHRYSTNTSNENFNCARQIGRK